MAAIWDSGTGRLGRCPVAVAVAIKSQEEHPTTSKAKLETRRATERKARERRDWLEQSVRTHLLPAFIQQGFSVAPTTQTRGPVDRDFVKSFPAWGRLRRARESGVDLVEVQFSSHGRAAFRINACAVPKEGMITLGGHRTAEELDAGGLHDHFETHARPWLKATLRTVGLEPLGAWFSVCYWPYRSPTQADYDKLAQGVAGVIVPELELALREGKLGPHIRRITIRPRTQSFGVG